MTALEDVIRPGSSRGLDFVLSEELRKRTGVTPDSVLEFALAEIVCNALDKDATIIKIDVHAEGYFHRLTVSDNGSRKLTLNDLKLILDFANKASSKRGLLRVTRGYLGNALKCIFGYSYALAESKGLGLSPIVVTSGGFEHHIILKPDRIKEIIDSQITTREKEDNDFTTFTVQFTKNDMDTSALKDLVCAMSMVNPTRQIHYNLFGDEGSLGSAKSTKQIRQETSILWYTENQFEALFDDFLRARPETQLKEFIPLFRGFSGKKIIGEILQALNFMNHDSRTNGNVQFFPATPIKDLPRWAVSQLFTALKAKAKPIGKRSIPSVLGCVGENAFESLREQNGWERLRYTIISSIKTDCSRYNHGDGSCDSEDHVEFPYLVELAVFDRKKHDAEGLKVYQCVNFAASTEDIFARIFDISHRLGLVGIREDMPVTVVAHLVCPVLKWLNHGKSGLDE